jgi:hypothetical protein
VPLPEDISAKSLESAVMTVIAIIKCGYHPNKGESPLNAGMWARLSCIVLAAIGRGYDCQYTANQGDAFNLARVKSFDPEPLTPKCPTYFHHLAVTTGTIFHHVKPPCALSDTNHKNTVAVATQPSPSGTTPQGRD